MSLQIANDSAKRAGAPCEVPVELAQGSILPGAGTVIQCEPFYGFVNAALLIAPELPKPPASPRLRPGLDFSPIPGDQTVSILPEAPAALRPSTVVPAPKSQIVLAAIAMFFGFGGGLLLAWALGVI